MRSNPRRVWWILGSLALTASLGLAGFALWIQRAGDRRWAETERRVQALSDDVRSREGIRVTLQGTSEPGLAWPHYLRAFYGLTEEAELRVAIIRYLRAPVDADPGSVVRHLEENGEAVRWLVEGARLSRAPFTDPPASVGDLGRLAAAQARLLGWAGRPDEGIDLMIDTLQFGWDCANSDIREGMFSLMAGLETLPELVRNPGLSPVRRSKLKGALERLLSEFRALQERADHEALMMGQWLRERQKKGGFKRSWRYGFSIQLMAAGAFDVYADLSATVSRFQALPWKDVESSLKKRGSEASTNPAVEGVSGGFAIDYLQGDRLLRTRIRLILALIHIQSTGEIPEVPDPFGDCLRHERSEKGLRLWSAGMDGTDDGGVGDWTTVFERGTDIVLHVSPR